MIITSHIKLEVNKIYNEKDIGEKFIYRFKTYDKYTLFVIREATLEEFRREVIKKYGADADDIINYEFFYEISMD